MEGTEGEREHQCYPWTLIYTFKVNANIKTSEVENCKKHYIHEYSIKIFAAKPSAWLSSQLK